MLFLAFVHLHSRQFECTSCSNGTTPHMLLCTRKYTNTIHTHAHALVCAGVHLVEIIPLYLLTYVTRFASCNVLHMLRMSRSGVCDYYFVSQTLRVVYSMFRVWGWGSGTAVSVAHPPTHTCTHTNCANPDGLNIIAHVHVGMLMFVRYAFVYVHFDLLLCS